MRAATPDQKSAISPASATPVAAVRLPRWVFPLVTVVSLLLGATSIVRGTRAVVTIADSDLTNFFLKSADYILRGDPWHMYAVRALGGYPNYNPPLSIFLLAPLLGLARALGFAANYGEQITFVSLPFIALVPLMGYLSLRVMRALYPSAPETLRLLLYAFVTLSPLTWQTYSIWYHVEQPLMLCLLLGAVLALQAKREGLAGLLAGLAFLSRTTALIPLVALGVLLLMTRAWRPLLKFGGVSAAVAALGFAPFVAFDLADVKYTFLSWRGGAPIGSDSIWTIFAYTGTSSHLRELINAGVKRLDMYVVMLVVIVAVALAVRRLRLTIEMRDMWALLAIAMLATPMLSKQVWPYYYLEPMVFIVVWELSTLQDRVAGLWRWPVLSVAFTLVAATLSQYIGLQSVGRLDALFVGVTQTALMAFFTLAIWRRIQARKPTTPLAESASYDSAGMQPMTPPGMAVAGAAYGAGPVGQFARPRQPAPVPPRDDRADRYPSLPPVPQDVRAPSQPGPRPQGQMGQMGQTPPAPAGGPASPAGPAYGAPAWPALSPEPVMGATPPRGANAIREPNPASPVNPSGPAAPQWPNTPNTPNTPGAAPRGGPPTPPNGQAWGQPMPPSPAQRPPQREPGGPGPDASPKPEGGLDPWRDWPNRR
ncbi:MAG TPA: glycosyltransferase 87 family protein [Ktedonobacterales bacterium]|nr:glycosyltransferase 87 family protein [Ktedonobacterales bacterium]